MWEGGRFFFFFFFHRQHYIEQFLKQTDKFCFWIYIKALNGWCLWEQLTLLEKLWLMSMRLRTEASRIMSLGQWHTIPFYWHGFHPAKQAFGWNIMKIWCAFIDQHRYVFPLVGANVGSVCRVNQQSSLWMVWRHPTQNTELMECAQRLYITF